jgi:chromosome segregation ATPase
MKAIWILSGVVAVLTIVSIVMWIVNGTQNFSGLERIIRHMGQSYEEISTCKDTRIKELEDAIVEFELMRVDIREKTIIITHLETRISDKDEELTRYTMDIGRLQKDNTQMERKLDKLKKNLGGQLE